VSKEKLTYLAAGLVVAVVAAALLWQLRTGAAGKAAPAAQPIDAVAALPPSLDKPPAPAPLPLDAGAPAPLEAGGKEVRRPSPPAGLPSEASLMEQLRKARKAGKHALAIKLAREGNRRFPDTALAPERHSILVHSLADDEQRSEARGEAEYMVNHYPDSNWVREIERFTGAHRHRNVRLNDAGEIEYY